MNFTALFHQLLINGKKRPSRLTVKNYMSDLRNFIRWYEQLYSQEFSLEKITPDVILAFQNDTSLSYSSKERRIAALKKFFSLLIEQGVELTPPFASKNTPITDTWNLKGFKNQLYSDHISPLTVKNYLLDIESFKKWIEQTYPEPISPRLIPSNLMQEYKDRMIHVLSLSPASVNRKLSSIRRYFQYIEKELHKEPTQNSISIPAQTQKISLLELSNKENDSRQYSSIPPIRLLQKIFLPISMAEEAVADLIARFIRTHREKASPASHSPLVKNISKTHYAPSSISTRHFSPWKKLIFHLKHTRPSWYHSYHSRSFTNSLHFSILLIWVVAVSFVLNQHFNSSSDNTQKAVLGIANSSQPSVLSFRGRLTDQNLNPITSPQEVQFSIYSDPVQDKDKVWQENQTIQPSSDGSFQVALGDKNSLPQSIFNDENEYYLGIKVGNSPELKPRKPLITSAYAGNSDTLQGMQPITATDQTANTILALDSSGNLTIGGTANPTFQATGGNLTLSGSTLILNTNAGSNGDIQLVPDGNGLVDIQAPIHNTGNTGPFPGAVTVSDTLAVNQTEPLQTALIVNNNGFGDLFTASTAGITKFVITSDGSVGIGVNKPTAMLDIAGNVAISGTTRINNLNYQWPSISGQGGYVLTNDGTGTLSWANINSLPGSAFTTLNNTIVPTNPGQDLFIGSQSTASATFAFFNSTPTPTASFNGNLTFQGNRQITVANMGSLTLGDSNTGAISFQNKGNVGIGIINPLFKLDLSDSQSNTSIARVYNTNTSPDADGLTIQLGNTSSSSVSTTNHFINFTTDGTGLVGAITGNGSNGVTYATGGVADFAEYLKKDPTTSFDAGTLACLDSNGQVSACINPGQVIGAISDHPAFLGGVNQGDNSVAVGLVGQLLVKISTENGQIKPGDPIGPSNIPGVGEKATQAGYILGRAIDSSDQAVNGEIHVLIHPSWYDPDVYLTQAGVLQTPEDSTISPLNPVLANQTSAFTVTSMGQVINRIGVFSQATIGSITAGVIDAQNIIVHGSLKARDIVVDQLNVTSDNISISGESLRDYIVDVIKSTSFPQNNKPQVYAQGIASNIISPLSDDSQISLDLSNSQLQVKNSQDASASAVTTIDNQGNITTLGNLSAQNATFSGTLTSTDLSTTNASISGNLNSATASISGTLSAGTIIANNIQGLDDKIATIASQYINNSHSQPQNVYGEIPAPQTMTLSQLPTNFVDTASISAGFVTAQNGLVALGPTTLESATVMDSFSIGTGFVFGTNSLDTLGQDLQIQPLKQGNISLMAGAVTINTKGDLVVSGDAIFAKNLTVQGGLAANMISPLPNQDLAINLGQKSSGTTQSLRILSPSKTPVLSINNSGDVYSSGSAYFAHDLIASGAAMLSKLNIFTGQAEAVSDTQVVASGSAGTATLKAYQREVTIETPEVTKNSLIYITPLGDTNNQVLYLERQAPGASFTVGVSQSAVSDIPFNWIIVN